MRARTCIAISDPDKKTPLTVFDEGSILIVAYQDQSHAHKGKDCAT